MRNNVIHIPLSMSTVNNGPANIS